MKVFKPLFIVLGFIFISGCSKKETTWDTNNTIPLFNTEMALNAISSNYLKPTSDSSYNLSYENLVYRYKIADLQASDTGIDAFFNLRKLKLNDRTINNSITLGDINPLFKIINGQQADIPAQDQNNLTPTDIDASAFFETATLDTGYLDISILNDLPVNISLIIFELSNAGDNSVVASDSFKNISKNGGIATKTIDLRGKTVTKNLKGKIKRLVTEASGGLVTIDASKGINVQLSVRRLRPSSAIAAFPTQNVIDQDEGITMYMAGAQVKYFKVKSGHLRIKVISTIEEDMSMKLALPGAIKDGKSFYQELSLPGPGGKGVATTEQIYDMAGYVIDFRGKDPSKNDTVNTFHQILKVTLDSSGRKLAVSLKDSIKLVYRIEGLKPEYATGYLGQSLNRTGAKSTPFDLFKGVDGSMKFKDAKVSFILRNSIGAEGRFHLYNLEGQNVFNNNKLTLNAASLKNDILVSKPKFVYGDYSETVVNLDSSNSNIKQFLETFPQQLNYDLETEISPNGNSNNFQDFVFDNSRLDVIMKVDIPASFSLDQLVLRDTQSVDFSKVTGSDRIKSAILFMDLDNSYPIELGLNINLLDETKHAIGTLNISPNSGIAPGIVDASGKPIQSTKTLLKIELDRGTATKLNNTRFFAIKAGIKGNNTMQRIFNNASLKIKSRMQFEYEVKN